MAKGKVINRSEKEGKAKLGRNKVIMQADVWSKEGSTDRKKRGGRNSEMEKINVEVNNFM